MRIAIVSESSADDAAMGIFLQAMAKKPIEVLPAVRACGGWPAILKLLPAELKNAHYRGDAAALVAFCDSDGTVPHSSDHETTRQDNTCRYCQLRREISVVQTGLKPIASREPIWVAIGLAVPCIEAWLQFGKDPHCTEIAFARRLQNGDDLVQARRELKRRVYGTDRPDVPTETRRMVEEAARLCRSNETLSNLELHFPGFKLLAQAVRAW